MQKAMTLETTRRGLEDLFLPGDAKAIPIRLVSAKDDLALASLGGAEQRWVEAQGWTPKQGSVLTLPDDKGGVSGVLLGTGGKDWVTLAPLLTGVLPGALPQGDYRFASALPDPELAALGFLAGSYRFTRYKPEDQPKPKRLVLPEGANKDQVLALAEALYFGRDLINTPANDLGPAELEAAARELANTFNGNIKVTEGSSLLSDNFPLIHAVGRASDRLPRLIDLTWGSERAPKVTIIGKGICFDTGGLDIKSGSGMALMKKDMGGAASALAFALLVMRTKLPVRLRVLIPAADNSIAGNAFRPGDVLPSRNGMSVEIGNTDAEGRLVLADLLAAANEEAAKAKDPLLVTIATLTGHAVRAVGPYPIAVENGPAHEAKVGHRIQRVADAWGEPFERSRLRREDYEHVGPKTDAEDVITINARVSVATPRGHQFPVAFLDIAAGLQKKGSREVPPRPFVHVDIAGSALDGDWPYGVPTGSPVVGLYHSLVAEDRD
jgi:leucyl aminopeptidase